MMDVLSHPVMFEQDCSRCLFRSLENCLKCVKVRQEQERQENEGEHQLSWNYARELNVNKHEIEGCLLA